MSGVTVHATFFMMTLALSVVLAAAAAAAAQPAVDYAAVAKAYGVALDAGVGWSGLVEATTASDASTWSGEACMAHANNVTTIKAYAEFNKQTKAQFPDAKSTGWTVAWDPVSRNAFAYGMWSATNTAGTNPTGLGGSTGFTYLFHFDAADKIDAIIMVWNDAWYSQQIGWGDACSCPATRAGASCYKPPPATPPPACAGSTSDVCSVGGARGFGMCCNLEAHDCICAEQGSAAEIANICSSLKNGGIDCDQCEDSPRCNVNSQLSLAARPAVNADTE